MNKERFPTYEKMQKGLSKSYSGAAQKCRAKLARVGDTWPSSAKPMTNWDANSIAGTVAIPPEKEPTSQPASSTVPFSTKVLPRVNSLADSLKKRFRPFERLLINEIRGFLNVRHHLLDALKNSVLMNMF